MDLPFPSWEAVSGVLGPFAGLLLYAVIYLYRDNKRLNDARLEDVKQQNKDYLQIYITLTETIRKLTESVDRLGVR